MSLSRRDLIRGALVTGSAAMLAPLLGACAARETGPPLTSGEVDLLMWTHDEGYVDFFGEALAFASERTPFDYSLSTARMGANDLVTNIIAEAVAGRTLPDLAGFEIFHFARLLRGDLLPELLEPLEPAISDDAAADLVEARVAPFSRDGHVYALDSDVPMVVYYRRQDLFDELGVPEQFESWEDLASFGASFHDRTGRSLGAVATGTDLGQVVTIFWMLLLQRGGGLFDADGELAIESPEAEDVLRFLTEGVQTGCLTTVADFYGPSMQTALNNDTVVGFWMANWYEAYGLRPNVPHQSGQWRISPLPPFSGGGGRTAVGGGTGFGAITGSEVTRAATDFLIASYLEPEQQIRRYEQLGYLPTRRSLYDDERLLRSENDYFGGQRIFAVYADLVDEVPPAYLSPDIQILQTALAGALIDAYRGRSTPAQALRAAADQFRSQADR